MKPTHDQVAFAQRMTKKQEDVLRALAWAGPFVMSASERGDAELYALIRMRLAQGWRMRADGGEFFTWDATPAGKVVADTFLQPSARLAPGPSRPPAGCGA